MSDEPGDQRKDPAKKITGLIGLIVFATFILGLSYSISNGFAGFNGGLPFMIIAIACILMALYDYWDECLRKR